MKTTIADAGNIVILMNQLGKVGISFLEINPHKDINVGDHQFAVYSAALWTKDNCLMNAWLVTVMGNSGYYNVDSYPEANDAVCQHIGRLAMEGKLVLVDLQDELVEDDNEVPPQEHEEV